jgi:hypothetical protein
MKKLFFLFLCLISVSLSTNSLQAQERAYLILKKYSFASTEDLHQTSQFIETSYLPALKKIGYTNIGVFVELPETESKIPDLYLLHSVKDIQQLAQLDAQLLNMGTWKGNQLPQYLRVVTTLMQTFEDMPQLQPCPLEGDRAQRIYELRSYESSNTERYLNKVDMFNAGGEITLFEELGFNAVFYGEVLAGSQMPNLMYMTTFENKEKRDQLWNQFFTSDKWEELKSNPFYQGNVSKADIIFMVPTAYSDY